MIEILIPGIPIPKARARVVGSRAYDPQSKQKKLVQRLMGFKRDAMPIESKIDVHMTFGIPHASKCDPRAFKASTWQSIDHAIKPDLSNLVKFYEDCANGILWKDDSQISRLTARKIYSYKPFTLITIRKITMHAITAALMNHFSPERLNAFASYCDEFLSLYAEARKESSIPRNAVFIAHLNPDTPSFLALAETMSNMMGEFSEEIRAYTKEIKKING